jgi:tetratricopeptide (TPR) repeat protein
MRVAAMEENEVRRGSSVRSKSPSNPRARVSFSDNSPMSEEKKAEEDNTITNKTNNTNNNLAPTNNDNNRKLSKRWSGRVKSIPSKKDQQDASSPLASKRGLMSGIGKRLSGRFVGDRRKGFEKVTDNGDDEDDDEDDPVMTIFESRNTQRVRFTLEGVADEAPRVKEEAAPTQNSGSGIKSFMSRALFGTSKSSRNLDEEMKREVAQLDRSLVWESAETPTGAEVVHTTQPDKQKTGAVLMLSFEEDPKARANVVKLLNKARRAEHIHFRYEYAVKCYLKALSILKKVNYPDDHPTVLKTVRLLNNAHHVLSSYKNSANIVKMGIKNEDSGELVKALKMYTIAYRIRRDNLTRNHPSLVVLLNMLGSIQIKRGELKEAMQIYELALQDSPVIFNAEDDEEIQPPTSNLLAKSVTYREMGTIYERWGNYDEALKMYHKSLECITDWKNAVRGDDGSISDRLREQSSSSQSVTNAIHNVQLERSTATDMARGDAESGEMELFLGPEDLVTTGCSSKGNVYESFFPPSLDGEIDRGSTASADSSDCNTYERDSYADMDLALTLHQIAQLHRFRGDFGNSLDAYTVALRGMKYALGKHHPNVAAILGNVGNLQKERGDLDAAFNTYQEVLGIESYRLGLSHPDVAITLHNIATIDAARGNHEHALRLYRKVIGLQKKLFGEDHPSVAITAACMGEVYEKLGEFSNAMESFEEAIRIKSGVLGRHSLDVGRLLHKLGKLAFKKDDYLLADSFISRAVLVYRLNKVVDSHEWVVDANRDAADIDGAIALGKAGHFEC